MRERAAELGGPLSDRVAGVGHHGVRAPADPGVVMTDLRVVIADDHPVFRSGLQALLGVEPGIEVVGEAETGVEAVALARDLQPDIVLMDLHMPELDGVAATKQITAGQPWRRGAGVHHVRRRRLGVRRDACGGSRIPAEGHQPSRGGPLGAPGRIRRRDVRAGGRRSG